ncbi:universal stress protein PHOS32-like [Nicotiana tabacum]|uniref:Universal stress protein A-like protein n=1 Tax=Nicotiana tabacum TaxID=4097 RepID=A0A1S4AQH8_TOBAC|nr:universal stress protein PHOS32-like [Nicotiana tomentosiformis]XP_016478820.1 PREDICTED: universal stress protein A-like protein [Nicotiana tabacum]
MSGKPVLIFAVDDSEHSFYALEWTLDHYFACPSTSPFKLVVIHAKSNAYAACAVGMAGPGRIDVLTLIETDIKRGAEKVIEKTKELCKSKRLKEVSCEVIEGDARNVICDAVDKHHASLLVMGSHGYGAFKRAVLGSVSDYCSHHANCSVMIVKNDTKPKQ